MQEILAILIGLFGGLALFLYGVGKMSDSLQAAAGDRIRQLLSRFTTHPVAGVVTGAVVTALIQSSSLTTVLIVGFVSAGLVTLRQAASVIMGANLGTTITIHIAAFKITDSAWLLIGAGFLLMAISRRDVIRQLGSVTLGLGLLFLALNQMSLATYPLRDDPNFVQWMKQVEFPPLGILLGAVFTAAVQSSSATSGLVIALVDENAMRLPAAVAIILGANLGTCITALLASWGRQPVARQAAMIHVLFNVFGVLFWVLLLPQLTWAVEHLATSAPRQVAVAHTLFNGVSTLLLLGFIGPLTHLAERLVPERRHEVLAERVPRFLDRELVDNPTLGLDRARMELGHIGGLISDQMSEAKSEVIEGRWQSLEVLAARDEDVDELYRQVVHYLRQIAQGSLSSRETLRLEDTVLAAGYLENISDITCENLVEIGRARLRHGVVISEGTANLIRELFEFVQGRFSEAIQAVVHDDVQAARNVVGSKGLFGEIFWRLNTHLRRRMLASTEVRLQRFQVEFDLANQLQRIFYFTRRLARLVLAESETTSTTA